MPKPERMGKAGCVVGPPSQGLACHADQHPELLASIRESDSREQGLLVFLKGMSTMTACDGGTCLVHEIIYAYTGQGRSLFLEAQVCDGQM